MTRKIRPFWQFKGSLALPSLAGVIWGVAGLCSVSAQAANLQTATLAAGCFWGTEEYFRKLPGVVKTQVGYSGGSSPATYTDVSSGGTGHAESVEIQFDPKKITYREILVHFFKMHDPTTLNRQGNDVGSQYRSAIFYHSEEQRKTAESLKYKIDRSGVWKKPLTTEIKKAGAFYRAEDYHQKYLQNHIGGYDNHYVRDLKID